MALNPQSWAVRAAAATLPYALAAVVGSGLSVAATWYVQDLRWQARFDSEAQAREDKAREGQEAAKKKRGEQREASDFAAGKHATELALLNKKLGDARAHIATLSDRQCLSAGTVRLLNSIAPAAGGDGDVRAVAGESESAAAAAAAAADDEAFASERNVSEFIATCRARYGEVSSQLNQILNIEEVRHAGEP